MTIREHRQLETLTTALPWAVICPADGTDKDKRYADRIPAQIAARTRSSVYGSATLCFVGSDARLQPRMVYRSGACVEVY